MNRRISKNERKAYKPESLAMALEKVILGELNIEDAARKYGVPRSTVYYRFHKMPLIGMSTGIKPKTHVNASSPGKMSKRSECCFCGKEEDNEVLYGKMYTQEGTTLHYFCLLFASGLAQNGEDDEGIEGFMLEDIAKEVLRGKKLQCGYCLRKGATIGCVTKKCRRTYHYPCGLESGVLFQFTDDFRSQCPSHRDYQRGQGIGETLECPICMEEMVVNPKTALWASCCKRNTWFHKPCLQQLALSAGYFFKCPLCNNKDIFLEDMRNLGIYVPEKDASWELEPNAFREHERPVNCDAPKCKCPDGRKSDDEGTRWEILLCDICGSTGVHIACGGLPFSCSEWNCPTCVEMLNKCVKISQLNERDRRLQERKNRTNPDNNGSPEQDMAGSSGAHGSDDNTKDPSTSGTAGTPGKRKRGEDDFILCTPSKVCCIEQETYTKITYASDSDEEIDIDSGEYDVPPLANIRNIEQQGEELSKELKMLKSYALKAHERMLELRLTETDIIKIVKESLHNKEMTLDRSHLTRFFRYNLTWEKMIQVAKLLKKVFAYREQEVLEAKSATKNKRRSGSVTPSGRKRKAPSTPSIKIPLLKSAISHTLISSGISPGKCEVETESSSLTCWSMRNSISNLLDTEDSNQKESLKEGQIEAAIRLQGRPDSPNAICNSSPETFTASPDFKSVARHKLQLQSDSPGNDFRLYLSPGSEASIAGSPYPGAEKVNKENEDYDQNAMNSPTTHSRIPSEEQLQVKKLVVKEENENPKHMSERSLASERYGSMLETLHVDSSSCNTKKKKNRKIMNDAEFEVTSMEIGNGRRQMLKPGSALNEFDVTRIEKEDSQGSEKKRGLRSREKQADRVVLCDANRISIDTNPNNSKNISPNGNTKKHPRTRVRSKDRYIQKSLSPYFIKQKSKC